MTREEWLLQRKKGIGSSDAPVIMGTSPWRNLRELYEDKISNTVEEKTSYVQERGIRMEPRIRSLYEIITQCTYHPALVSIETAPYMMCSLDGRSEDGKTIIEIKVSGRADWESGVVPEKYYPQIQHALLVSGAEKCVYLSYLFTKEEPKVLNLESLVTIDVFPDVEYQKELFIRCTDFWYNCVEKRVSP